MKIYFQGNQIRTSLKVNKITILLSHFIYVIVQTPKRSWRSTFSFNFKTWRDRDNWKSFSDVYKNLIQKPLRLRIHLKYIFRLQTRSLTKLINSLRDFHKYTKRTLLERVYYATHMLNHFDSSGIDYGMKVI